ncbi:hypothetical protein [Sphingomonas xinjiangensis]|uniref:Sugar/nucleoside kinase (Ribokinase family) n=1 Tax=Sphingomonas xinjiangensis TaxID=643568 RepID=A0A840YTS3_9SPHN|nr:hypothetical protein [Sphingomonas xinjiangensis]MBB5713080.1 sugar/nucleoside kinase (ribokinase family) [Sphingomonas xinjiangensis]
MSIEAAIAHQKKKRAVTLANIEQAKVLITEQVDRLGYYPNNRGRVTIAEVCKLASIGASTLKNSTHSETAEDLRKWLKALNKRLNLRQSTVFRVAETETLQAKLEKALRNADLYKLMYEESENRLAASEADNAVIRAEMSKLRAEKLKIVQF